MNGWRWFVPGLIVGLSLGWWGFGFAPKAAEMERELAAIDSLRAESRVALDSARALQSRARELLYDADRCNEVRYYLDE